MRHRHKKKFTVLETPGTNPEIARCANDLAALDLEPGNTSILSPEGETHETRTTTIRTTSITFAIPMDEQMYSKFFQNFGRLGIMPWDSVLASEDTYLPQARNFLHAMYLEKCQGSPFLMMLDSDVLPPIDVVSRLIKHDLPIVGGWYKTKRGPIYGNEPPPCVYDYDRLDENGIECYTQRTEPGTGLEKVDGIGAGCLLMKRELAEALGKKPYDMNSGGEDLKLCRAIQKLGYKIYVDWSVACAHVGVWFV